jgi:sporulation protein YlmC with PRC-barrel domain
MKALGKLTIAIAVAVAAGPAWGQDKEKRADLIRLSDMTGKAVWLKDGTTEAGTVKDVVVDLQRGRAVVAVVEPKDDSNRFVAVPVNKLRAVRKADGKGFEAFRLDDDKGFADYKSVGKDEWDRKDDRAALGRLADKADGFESLARAGYVKKASVVDARGDRVGEVDEIMVNLENSRLLALVGVGGVLGVGERRHVVPWEILRVREHKKEGPASFTLNVPKETLEKGPVLGKDEENRLSDPKWVAGLYDHYQYGPLGGEREQFRVVMAERVLGLGVGTTSKPDDEIGDIEGLAIVPHTGKIAYVAFEHDGKLYAIPLDAFKFTFDKDHKAKAVLDATKDTFKTRAAFDKDRWPDKADAAWMGGVEKKGMPDERREGVAPLVLRSSDVLDADVKDSRRVTFGEVEDFALDLDANTVLFSVVGSGGFLGIGETMYAIPWKAMSWAGDKDKFFTVNADRKTLERSVEFDEKRLKDANYLRSIYSGYGLEFEHPKHERPGGKPRP